MIHIVGVQLHIEDGHYNYTVMGVDIKTLPTMTPAVWREREVKGAISPWEHRLFRKSLSVILEKLEFYRSLR